MYPGFTSQFQNGISSNAQQDHSQSIPNPQLTPTSSSSQFTQANETPNQRRQAIPISMQPVQISKQPNQVTHSQPKQLTIQQSLHQNIQQALSQPPKQQSQRQVQSVIQQHPMSQQSIQNSLIQNMVQHPIQQTVQSNLQVYQQMPMIQINATPNNIQLQNQFCMINQSQMPNIQIHQQNNLPRVPYQMSNASLNQNLSSKVNQQLNNILQQFSQNPAPEPTQSFDDDEFQVEGIAEEREVKGKRQYLVQWYGFSDDENTWEDESNLSRYCQLINDFRMNGPKQRTQKRVLDFISGFVSNGKVHYNVLFQNDEVATLTGLQARGSRFKQQLINFLEREAVFPEKERVVIPPKPPKQPKLQASSSDGLKPHSSAGLSEYEYEYVDEEEEENEKGENIGIVNKKRIKRKKKIYAVSTDEPGSTADIEPREDVNSEVNDEIKMQAKILHDDPIENTNLDGI